MEPRGCLEVLFIVNGTVCHTSSVVAVEMREPEVTLGKRTYNCVPQIVKLFLKGFF